MGMSIATDGGGEDDVVAAINTTPLVDVMLVLLIIFLITIPVATHTVPVNLPREAAIPLQTKPDNIAIAVTRNGDVFWNEQRVSGNRDLENRLRQVATLSPQPEVQIRGDGDVRYEPVGRVIFACQKAGIVKVGFITEPPSRSQS